jgi:ABC-type transport system involved in multi-copper enzyme maturation permease subunit
MLGRVAAIALNTFRESLRARILLGLMGVAFAVAFYSIVVGSYTLRNAQRVVSDLGSASISLFGILAAIVISSTSLYRELEQKTLFPILARPIRRGEYLVGKYLGTLLTIAVFVMANAGLVLLLGAGMSPRTGEMAFGQVLPRLGLLVAAGAVIAWRVPKAATYGPIPWSVLALGTGIAFSGAAPEEQRVVLAGSLLAFLEIAVIAAFGTLFSSFSTPFLSALLTAGVILIGRNADVLAQLPAKFFGQGIHEAGVVLSRVVPNLHVYVPPRPLLTGEAVGEPLGSYLAMAAAAAVAWSVALLAVAGLVFRKRDFL